MTYRYSQHFFKVFCIRYNKEINLRKKIVNVIKNVNLMTDVLSV